MTARTYALPLGFTALVIGLATLLLTVGARSPYTHGNLLVRPQDSYSRTALALVGSQVPAGTVRPAATVSPADIVARGRVLFVTSQCASCHGLQGQGGPMATAIAGTKAQKLREKALKGPGGMPMFVPAMLTDDDFAAIAAYLKSVTKPGGG